MTAERSPLLSAVEAARRLGVKPETLYAYVSRGFLTRVKTADGRRSAFDPAEIDRLMTGARRTAARGGPVIHTRVTEVRGGELLYRGVRAVELAGSQPYEAVARLLWTGALDPTPFSAPDELIQLAASAARALPGAPALDRIRAAVVAVGAADPLRADLRPAAVVATAATMLAAVIAGLPDADTDRPPDVDTDRPPDVDTDRLPDVSTDPGGRVGGGATLAGVLWPKLTTATPDERLLDATLVLLADHEPGPPAVVARLVASARAHPYAVAGAALASVAAPAQTPGCAAIHRALADAEREGTAAVLARLLTEGRGLPGFGHARHPDGDPRARALLDRLAASPPDSARWLGVTRFIAASARGAPVPPNVDLALAALSYTSGMAPDAGEAVFAVARMAGWLAQAIEEYAEEPGRLPDAVSFT